MTDDYFDYSDGFGDDPRSERHYYEYLKTEINDAISYTYAISKDTGEKYIFPLVYTLYDENDCPLYVGSTQSIADRIDWHMRKDYWTSVRTIGIRAYPDREQMRIAELYWIFAKKPKYNNDGKYDDAPAVFYPSEGITVTDDTTEILYKLDELDFIKDGFSMR